MNIRPYEISLWTLQDSFITILKPLNVDSRGRIETPKIIIKNDGTQEMNFSIPMYYQDNGKLIENPIWYTIRDGILIENLRKIKVIFNKGEEGEEIFEFVINKITETHENGQLHCSIEAEGLAFQELGKVGYKISLSQEDFEVDYEKWWNSTVGENGDYTTEEEKNLHMPIQNLQYWADKIFENCEWSYSIQMDWSSFDGVIEELDNTQREKRGLRRTDRIYEEEYISAWQDKDGVLVPSELVDFQEKARPIEVSKSNRYNITQDLAEAFGVYCKYKYHYDKNYHIIGKECIFYNNFLDEKSGKTDINYPFDGSKITREKDSSDCITKMFVVPISSDVSPSGLITIADVPANKSKEDYILNFDYLYSIGTITDEQYNAVEDYQRSMFNYNTELEPISSQLANLSNELVEYQAQKTLSAQGQIEDKEQMEKSTALLNSIAGDDGILEKTIDTPYRGILLEEASNEGKYYIKISQEGVIEPTGKNYPIKIYYYKTSGGTKVLTEYTDGFIIKKDDCNNIVSLNNIKYKNDSVSKIYYITFSYRPQLQYENIYNTFAKQLVADEAAEKEADIKIEEIELKIKELKEKQELLLKKKNHVIADFENMMGPALREGFWQSDSYTDYGEKYNEEIAIGSTSSNKYLKFSWDKELFDGEQLNYYETFGDSGEALTKVYYPCINLSNCLDKIKNNLNDLSFIYNNKNETMTIGSQAQFAFLSDGATAIPVLLLTNKTIVNNSILSDGFIGLITSKIENGEVKVDITELVSNSNISFIDSSSYTLVYPRLVIENLSLKTSDDTLSVKYNEENLEKYNDFSLLARDSNYYITIKNSIILKDGIINKTFNVTYEISNSALALYLDALEVSKNNASPQVSYSIDVSSYNQDFIKYIYNKLNKIVNINDAELKFNNVHGYISEIEMDLDKPWEDEITIQNYKTKFEDLFSSIVASTEQMKSNMLSYNVAANAFTSSGSLKQNVIQNSINNVDLTYAFNSGKLTINEVNGIWATSDSGVVAMRGGGIFCATEQDSYGNWIWNTGITPSGINAGLLTAGQIDTNLIRIFAGDDLRFQLNGDGLYAFKGEEGSSSEADYSQYVVHNSDGLFFTDLNIPIVGGDKNSQNRVEISWDGLILRNNEGQKVFYADNNGNLTISGIIKAESGDIGGWLVSKEALYSANGLAGLSSSGSFEGTDRVFWAGGDIFKVEADGTLYANNAIIKGTISANSVISGATAGDISDSIKKIEVVNVSGGDTFNYYNDNYDGNIIISPDILRYRIFTNSLTEKELGTSDWIFEYSNPLEVDIEGNQVWTKIDTLSETKYFRFEVDYLTFTVKDDIMSIGGTLLETLDFRVSKKGLKLKLDSDGYPIKNALGEDEYEEYTYTDYFTVRSKDYGINKLLSMIDPPSYTFIEDKNNNITYEDSTVFSVILTNIDPETGYWSIAGENGVVENFINANDNITMSTPAGSSSIASENELYINGVKVLEGDIINADDTIESEDGIITTSTFGNIIITNTLNEDGTYTSSLTLPNSKVPEGGQVLIRYIVDKAMRTAFAFKIKNGSDSINVIIRSSSGNSFINGEGETILSTELYYGSQIVNDSSSSSIYYYVWKEDGVALSTIKLPNFDIEGNLLEPIIKERKIDKEDIFSYKEVLISPNDFTKKADYSCYVFTTIEEAVDEYLKNNEEQIETKEDFYI